MRPRSAAVIGVNLGLGGVEQFSGALDRELKAGLGQKPSFGDFVQLFTPEVDRLEGLGNFGTHMQRSNLD